MAATIEIHSFHGTAPGAEGPDVASGEIRHKLADNDTVDVNNPIPVPGAGIGFGWRKQTKMKVASGLGTQVGNIRWFAAAPPGDWAGTVALYAGITPTYVEGTSGDESAQLGGTITADSYTSSDPLTVNASADAITQNSSYGDQSFVLQQVGVFAGTASGVKTARTCTYRYDEI